MARPEGAPFATGYAHRDEKVPRRGVVYAFPDAMGRFKDLQT